MNSSVASALRVSQVAEGDDPRPVQHPPTSARLFRVAAGLAEWTAEEEAWLDENPEWFDHELLLRLAFQHEVEGPSPDVREELAAAMSSDCDYHI